MRPIEQVPPHDLLASDVVLQCTFSGVGARGSQEKPILLGCPNARVSAPKDKKKKKGEVRKRDEDEELEGFSDDDTEIKKADQPLTVLRGDLGVQLGEKRAQFRVPPPILAELPLLSGVVPLLRP